MTAIKIIKGDNKNDALKKFVHALFDSGAFSELLIPVNTESGQNAIPTLIHDKSVLDNAEPLSPVMNGSSATLLVQLTEEQNETKLAAVVRPCEARAVVELIKLKQIVHDNLLMISADCLGTFSLRNYGKLIEGGKTGSELLEHLIKDRFASVSDGTGIREACRLCEFRESPTADIKLEFIGLDSDNELIAVSQTEKGEDVLKGLDLPDGEEVSGRGSKLKEYAEQTENVWKELAQELDSMTATPEDLDKSMDLCIKCLNCMNMCPICYCKECFFKSAPVMPSPTQYTKRAAKKGSLRMPSDKMLFQLGRMNHMISSCIQCGQCLEACPNDVEYLRQFPYMAKHIQKIFEYVAGKSLDEPLPLADFKEDELESTSD
jgi:formate dehydrogenase subunit beta